MNSRRDFLQIYARCAGVSGGGNAVPIDLDTRRGFPNVGAFIHTGEAIRFYEDCIQDKVFAVNFMSTGDKLHRESTENLAKTVRLLGDKVGRDIFVTSITVDPANDTVERLAAYAKELGAPQGWRFMRMLPVQSASITQRMYHHNRGGAVSRLVFYGNGGTRLWGSYPSMVRPEDAADRIAWVLPRPRPEGLRRGGPSRAGESSRPWNNRAV